VSPLRSEAGGKEPDGVDEGGVVNYFRKMCSGSEAGSYLRLIDVCITQL